MDEAEYTYNLLDKIDSPADLRKLSVEQLPEVCSEIRHRIIEVLAEHPGHLASSLGAVEITVALHYVFNTPEDRIVWDVGHQAYGHKILTGRRDAFSTNRQLGGLKPFPSPEESEYDSCVCGHASNSISIGLGMDVAARIQGQEERKVAVVIGDGAMSGGLAFEGLNNVSSTPNNMLIILNDNNMSIDRSVGGMKQYLLRLHTSKWYNRFRFRTARGLDRMGLLNEKRKNAILRLNNSLKSLITREQNIFEGLNIRYFGPADGHDVVRLVKMLQRIKDMSGPKLLHIHTLKGKGLEAAEKNAAVWHAPGMFDPKTGELINLGHKEPEPPKFQEVFGETLLELAQKNDKIVGVTPAMPSGCSMTTMMVEMPNRVFDVGIAEGHAVTFSAGMAKDGLLPFCNIYSSFAQRAYDNIIHDVAIGGLHVIICLDRAGLVGEDGPTHHGAFDIAALRTVPNLIICSPMTEPELRNLMYTATLHAHPWVIRYPRGKGSTIDWRTEMQDVAIGTGRKLRSGSRLCVLSIGPLGVTVDNAIRNSGLNDVAHYDMRFVKPLDDSIMREVAEANYEKIITIEDGSLKGGFGSCVGEWLESNRCTTPLQCLGLPDNFVEHGPVKELYRITGLDEDSIKKVITV
ncbi:MAG: 1-deoxy-D-xylulose-5-phosphate synthase [Bacteroidaceae bacterium]|nr:1-deoxy-D-xylulose-5-phosphate synthase [Bacteroidaceae bacterium]